MNDRAPCVSICLPVFNGENYVREAIKSALEQSFAKLELIISDNASTDGTADICRDACVRDQRVRYFRADVNHGLARNFNSAFHMARGRFVMWMGHDDIIATDYVSRCVETMEADREVVLCFAHTNYIDEKGVLIKRVKLQNDGTSASPSERFKNIVAYHHKCEAIFGLMRREVLKETRLHGGFADSDRVLLAEMGLRGRFELISDYLISRREHPLRTTMRPDRWERTLIFDPSKSGKLMFPFLREALEFFYAVGRAPIPWSERLHCYEHLLRWFYYLRGDLYKDLARGLDFSLHILRSRTRPTVAK
jgi:glycosyltransferase involved in cell wall biosynthesis